MAGGGAGAGEGKGSVRPPTSWLHVDRRKIRKFTHEFSSEAMRAGAPAGHARIRGRGGEGACRHTPPRPPRQGVGGKPQHPR